MLELLACSVDLDARVARWPDGERTLTPTEAKLLAYLVDADGRVIDRAELLEQVWGYRRGVISRTVKVTVARLRAKTEREPRAPDHLMTVIGAGYRFVPASSEAVTEARASRTTVVEEVRAPRVRLPARPTSLVGREASLSGAEAALSGSRLVTLVGPAGVGKSSLARELGHRLAARADFDEIMFVELGGTRTGGDLHAAVASALGVSLEPGEQDEVAGALAGALRSRGRLLVLLDDGESVAPELGRALSGWLESCPDATFLLTSREGLRLRDEAVVLVEPLEADDAVALFRARLPRTPAAGYTDGAVADLVVALDRLPLAIEMAAAWGDLLPAPKLVERLEAQLDVLRSARRDPDQKHDSLRSAVASSWELLEETERVGLCQLAVFADGFTIDDAEAVTGGPALRLLRRLRDRSLLKSTEVAGEPGMRLFRAVRDFAREQGRDEDAERRHGLRVARWGEEARLRKLARQGGPELVGLVQARGDLLLAAERARSRGDGDVFSACVFALAALADLRGPALAPVDLLRALGDADAPIALRGRVSAASVLHGQGRPQDALRELDAADALLADVEPAEAARALLGMARILGVSAPSEAMEVTRRAARAAQQAGAEDLLAAGTALAAGWSHALGESAAAQAGFETALPGLRAAGDLRGEGHTLAALARIHAERGRPRRAIGLHEQALALVREVGDRLAEARELDALAELHVTQEDWGAAEECWDEAMEVAREAGDRQLLARIAAHRAVAARRSGEGEAVRPRLLEALELARETGELRTQAVLLGQLGELDLELGHLPAARVSLLRAVAGAERLGAPDLEGTARGALGELLCGLGEVQEGREQLERGRALLDGAQRRLDLVELLERHAGVEAALGERAAAERLLMLASDAAQLSQLDGWI